MAPHPVTVTGAGRRVLILSAEVGEGHRSAAAALYDALLGSGAEAICLDGLESLGSIARRSIRDGYRAQLRTAPWTFNLVYRCWRTVAPLRWAGGEWLYRAGRRRLRALIAEHAPDVVVSTHPALTAVLGRMRRRHELDVALCATVLDLVDDPMWCDRGVDLHLVSHPVAVPWVQRRVGAGAVQAAAPLIAAAFGDHRDRRSTRRALGLPEQGSLIVISGGGWGVGALGEGIDAALTAGAGHVVALAGRNAAALARLRSLHAADPRVTVLGFTERMAELLGCANAIVHGTGGATSYEAIACGCPLIAHGTRLPHVREHNRVLAQLGMCTVVSDARALRTVIAAELSSQSSESPEGPGAMRAATRAAAAGALPQAAALILASRPRLAGPSGAKRCETDTQLVTTRPATARP